MNRILVVAPHPDDETLGCGATLHRFAAEKVSLHWIMVTGIFEPKATLDEIKKRDLEIAAVTESYGFDSVHQLGFPTTTLDQISLGQMVPKFAAIFKDTGVDTVFLPHGSDAHSDHRIVFEATTSALKWFRSNAIKRIYVYETLSETEQALNPATKFEPRVFFDITKFLNKKIETMKLYEGEMGQHPFPRSEDALRALASYRGLMCGCSAAEAFMPLREVF